MNHDDVVKQIKAMLTEAESPATDDCCIYRVPFVIRTLNKDAYFVKKNEDAYTPTVVSIGPFHHDIHPRLKNMERHKRIYCKAFFERTQSSLETFIHYIENVEPNFRRCYSDTLELTKEVLVKLILVDSCFILELFWRYYYDEWSVDDAFLLKPWLASNIRLDLLLLENQLPFFVLEKLFNLSFSSSTVHGSSSGKVLSFLDLTIAYFAHYNNSKLASANISSIRHFTDLIRIFHLQRFLERQLPPHRKGEQMKHLQSATELLEAGVRFKENTESDYLLDLRFSGRVLEIPQLNVDDWTEVLFRNIMALEQCHYPYESYFTDYVTVLDFLINTGRDVDILIQEKILVNELGDSDSAANMFNSLRKNITHLGFNSDYFILCEKLNDFCRDPFHKLRATLKRDYCSTTWQIVASLAGILLLFLSLLQSVCSVLQVVQQQNDSSKT